jgi:hypothetical protein
LRCCARCTGCSAASASSPSRAGSNSPLPARAKPLAAAPSRRRRLSAADPIESSSVSSSQGRCVRGPSSLLLVRHGAARCVIRFLDDRGWEPETPQQNLPGFLPDFGVDMTRPWSRAGRGVIVTSAIVGHSGVAEHHRAVPDPGHADRYPDNVLLTAKRGNFPPVNEMPVRHTAGRPIARDGARRANRRSLK